MADPAAMEEERDTLPSIEAADELTPEQVRRLMWSQPLGSDEPSPE